MSAKNKAVAIVVTTEHKGVFFGYGIPSDEKSIRITNARMCVYWSADVKSVLGLAATGPSKSCRVGPSVPAITLNGVTSVMECSPESEKAWGGGPWA